MATHSAAIDPTRLPPPGSDALAHSARLVTRLAAEIEASGGRIGFDRFMELALYAPGLGYYSAGARKFGETGDFVTAPELSPLFAQCLARACSETFDQLGGGDLLEVGAGSGVLAAGLLAELQRLDALPGRYRILDLSPELRERQRQTLAEWVPDLLDRVEWLEQLPPSGMRGVTIANELIDALPVHRFRIAGGVILEQSVVLQEGRLALAWHPLFTPGLDQAVAQLREQAPGIGEGYESEINLRAGPWLAALAEHQAAGLVLLIDYGYERAAYYHAERDRGTLMCHYRHRAHSDPLCYPGLQDITAHVDFSALALAAQQAGFGVCGYTTQAFFLMGCGLEQLVAASDPDDVESHLALMQGVKRLTLPSEMGERFRVLGLCREIERQPAGFSLRDLRGRL